MPRLAPGIPKDKLAQRIQDDSGFANDWMRGQKAIEEEQEEGGTLPHFLPGANCEFGLAYGFSVYEKAALLTEGDVTKIFGKTSRQLDLKPWTGNFNQPGTMMDALPINQIMFVFMFV